MPGIAGLALTIGMAVDANVIVFERIREEMRAGKTVRAAVATGFDKALLGHHRLQRHEPDHGAGPLRIRDRPIKGFAVTLAVGIVTSVFAALVITRLFFHIYPGNRPVETLSI